MPITFSANILNATVSNGGDSTIQIEYPELLRVLNELINQGEITLLDLKNLMLPVIIASDEISLAQELPISQFTELTNAYFNSED